MSAAYMNQYFENQVNTASPEQLLIMLYNGAIRFVGEAEEAMTTKKIAYRGERVSKTIAILTELSATLDHEIGGEIAANLAALYDYMIRTLLAAISCAAISSLCLARLQWVMVCAPIVSSGSSASAFNSSQDRQRSRHSAGMSMP